MTKQQIANITLLIIFSKGRRGVVDRPLVPYTKYWKALTKQGIE